MEKPFKIVLVGSSGVGKTSICGSFSDGKPNIMSDTTIGISFYNCILNGYKINLWDTAGQERYRSLVPMYIRDSQMVIAVYDVENDKSYDELVIHWIPYIEKINPDINICIVESKIESVEGKETEITKIARSFAEDNGYLFWRVSSKEYINITEMFTDIINKLKSIKIVSKPPIKLDIPIPIPTRKNYCC